MVPAPAPVSRRSSGLGPARRVTGVVTVATGYSRKFHPPPRISGRAFGRRKLVPRLSPGKTVEGLCGGLALASITGWLLLGPAFEVAAFGGVRGLVFGLVAGAAGALGDLVESLLKRARQVKDSGRLLPEFGGILDMIDSPLLAAPVVTLLVAWFG